MSDEMSASGLLKALRQLLPRSTLSVIHQRPWHSLTFTGVQLRISADLSAQEYADVADRVAKNLPDHEFNIRGQIVADIAVTDQIVTADATILTIDALLLED
jgi:hypothetical protein